VKLFNLSQLAAGAYTVTVIDNAQCETTTEVIVTEPSAIVLQMSSTVASSDSAADGTAAVGVQGGTPNFTFLWNDANAQTTELATNLPIGDYCVTVTDTNGCEAVNCVSVTVSGCASLAGNTSSTSVTCNGFDDGTATIDVIGGSGTYTYAWSSGGMEQTETGLTAGLYFVTVMDTDDCVLIGEVTVEQPSALTVQLVEQNNIECEGQTSGSATVQANGGTSGYTYAWSNGGEGETQMNLAADDYDITATDANNCQTTFSFSIVTSEDVTIPTVLTQNLTFEADPNGITLGPEAFDAGSFDNCGIVSLSISQSTFTCDDLGENEVFLFATDVNGNMNSAPAIVTIIDTTEPSITCPTEYAVECDGTVTYADIEASDACGLVTINIPTDAESGSVFPVGTTVVTAEAIDNSGNLSTCTFEIVVESILEAAATGIDVSCNGGNDGDVVITAIGGVAPYTFTVENGAPGQLSAGTYTVVATDSEGCSSSTEVEILEPEALTIEVSQVIDEQNTVGNGAIVVDVNGGVGDYTFSWTGPDSFSSDEEDLLNLSAGDYVLIVTDENGCELTSEIITVDRLTLIDEPIWAQDLRLFPNPVREVLTIELPLFAAPDLEVELLNVTGQLMQVIDKERNSNALRINVSNLPSGLYWVKMQMEGEIIVKKVVVD